MDDNPEKVIEKEPLCLLGDEAQKKMIVMHNEFIRELENEVLPEIEG